MRERQSLAVRIILSACLLAGASTHVLMLWPHGLFWDYGGVPAFTRVYWTSLTFLDPLAAVLLFVRPRIGLALTLAIISSDVAHNSWFIDRYDISFGWIYAAQCGFLVFVVATFPGLWRSSSVASQSSEQQTGHRR
jgi:hypothetical protein